MTFTIQLNVGGPELERIAAALEKIAFQQSKPGQLFLLKREGAMSTINFKVLLPTLLDLAGDVVTRELSIAVGEQPPEIRSLPTDATEADGYSGPQDSMVIVTLTDIDDAGNRSLPSVLNVVLTDTFPPNQSGELGIVQTGETA